MIQVDTLESIKDTAQATVVHVADSLHGTAEALSHARAVVSVLPDTADVTAVDTLEAGCDSLLNLSAWPVTMWGDTLVAPQSLSDLMQLHGQALPFSIMSDDLCQGVIMSCFVVVVLVLTLCSKYFKEQMKDFFLPTNNQEALTAVKKPSATYTPWIMSAILCTCDGLLLFAVANQHYYVQAGYIPSGVLLGLCVGCFFVYNLLRWILYSFVNWIFFAKVEKRSWNSGFSFLLTLEGLLGFLVVIMAVNMGWDDKTIAIALVSVYVLMRILLLYHSFRIFFPKLYGLLHLFAYLCTLELIPLLVLWKFVETISCELLVK